MYRQFIFEFATLRQEQKYVDKGIPVGVATLFEPSKTRSLDAIRCLIVRTLGLTLETIARRLRSATPIVVHYSESQDVSAWAVLQWGEPTNELVCYGKQTTHGGRGLFPHHELEVGGDDNVMRVTR